MRTKINWYDLPDRTVIKLDEKTQTKILDKGSMLFSKKKDLAKALGITFSQLNLYFKKKSNPTVRTLKRLTKVLSIKRSHLNERIIEVGRMNPIKNPKLPFNLHSEGGVILRSIVNSEGHIPLVIGTSMHIRVPEEDILKTAIHCCKNIFGDFKVKIKPTKGKNTKEIFLPCVIADCLIISGLTRGRKSKINPTIPVDILNGNKDVKRLYLQWSFVSEMESSRHVKLTRAVDVTDLLPMSFIKKLKNGAVFKNQIPKHILELIIRKPNLLMGEISLLKSFKINKSPKFKCLWKAKNGHVSAEWSIWLTNKREFEILANEIGLPVKEKSDKIKRILDSYKRDNILKQNTYLHTYKLLKRLQNEKSEIFRKDLVKAFNTKWSDNKASRHLNKFLEKGIILHIGKGKYMLSDRFSKTENRIL